MRAASVWLAVLALPVHALPGWPLQPAELLALPLIVQAGQRVLRNRPRLAWTGLDVGVLTWLAAVLVASGCYLARHAAIDASVLYNLSATAYLTLLYFAIRVIADNELIGEATTAFVASATLAAALGTLGFVLSQLNVSSLLAFHAESAYPYLGTAARARALTATPNMLASILTMAIVILAARAPRGAGRQLCRFGVGVLGLGLLLTFSKTLLALAAALAVLWAVKRGMTGWARLGSVACWTAAALVYTLFSHVVILRRDSDPERLTRTMFIAGEPLEVGSWFDERYAAYATSYLFQKRASLVAIRRSWPWGIGPGRHPALIGELQQEGLFPTTLWPAVPHSSYTGTAAELGLAGVLGLVGLLLGASSTLRDSLSDESNRPLAIAAVSVLAAVSIEAITTDVMHFRHYAWLAALVAGAGSHSRS